MVTPSTFTSVEATSLGISKRDLSKVAIGEATVEVARVYNKDDTPVNLSLTWTPLNWSYGPVEMPSNILLEADSSKLITLSFNASHLGNASGLVEIKAVEQRLGNVTGGLVLPAFDAEVNVAVVEASQISDPETNPEPDSEPDPECSDCGEPEQEPEVEPDPETPVEHNSSLFEDENETDPEEPSEPEQTSENETEVETEPDPEPTPESETDPEDDEGSGGMGVMPLLLGGVIIGSIGGAVLLAKQKRKDREKEIEVGKEEAEDEEEVE